MGLFKKLGKYILPEKIDFFGKLSNQINSTSDIVTSVCNFYCNQENVLPAVLEESFISVNKNRQSALSDLSRTFITPVDKEALSRLYFHLNNVVLKVKHLNTEMKVYEIFNLETYESLLNLLMEEVTLLKKGFELLQSEKSEELHSNTDKLLSLSNSFSKNYAVFLNGLFKESNTRKIFEIKEILFQLKEINHAIVDTNFAVEDILFKMN